MVHVFVYIPSRISLAALTVYRPSTTKDELKLLACLGVVLITFRIASLDKFCSTVQVILSIPLHKNRQVKHVLLQVVDNFTVISYNKSDL